MTHKNAILEENGETLFIDLSTNLFPEAVLTVCREDWKRLAQAAKGARWSATHASGKGAYQRRTVAAAYIGGKKILAHRVLYPDCQAVRFLNGNALDLSRGNAVPGTLADCRSGKAHADSKTGVQGVTPSGDKYRLDMGYKGKVYYIGRFETVEEAGTVRDELRETLEGLPESEGRDFLKNTRSK